jgi:hypothetical protein
VSVRILGGDAISLRRIFGRSRARIADQGVVSMELFRFVAVERPSAIADDRGLRMDLESYLEQSELARDFEDPRTRSAKIRELTEASFAVPELLQPKVQALDFFVDWLRRAKG